MNLEQTSEDLQVLLVDDSGNSQSRLDSLNMLIYSSRGIHHVNPTVQFVEKFENTENQKICMVYIVVIIVKIA